MSKKYIAHLTQAQYEALQRMAEKQARSMNYIVMAIISERMKQEAAK